MALLNRKGLYAGALFAGALLAGQNTPTVAPQAPATATLPTYYSAGKEAHLARLREEDEAILAVLQLFVMEN